MKGGIGLKGMDILLSIILVLSILQIATIVHEFGHAIMALLFSDDNVKIILGKKNTKVRIIRFSRLHIEIYKFDPFVGFTHYNSSKMTRMQKIIAIAGGPIISLIIGVSLILVSRTLNQTLIRQIVIFSAYSYISQFLLTAIPIVYPKWWSGYGGHTSDGHKVMSLMKFGNLGRLTTKCIL